MPATLAVCQFEELFDLLARTVSQVHDKDAFTKFVEHCIVNIEPAHSFPPEKNSLTNSFASRNWKTVCSFHKLNRFNFIVLCRKL